MNLHRPMHPGIVAVFALLTVGGCRSETPAPPLPPPPPAPTARDSVRRFPLDYRGPRGQTALHMAARAGNLPEMERLVDAGLPADAKDGDGRTPLFDAVEYAHAEAVRWLLARGADPRASTRLGYTPLLGAARSTSPAVSGKADWPMGLEAKRRLTEAGALLLQAGADPNAANDQGQTPLHGAASSDNAELARLMLDAGADPNRISRQSGTPLRSAAQGRHPELVRLLLEKRADPRAGDERERQLLVQAASRDDEVMALLMRAGLDLSGEKAKSAMYLAAIGARRAVVARLIDAGFGTPEVLGSALLGAVSGGENKNEPPGERLAVVRLLVDAGAPVNYPYDTGAALASAASSGHDDIVRLLQERGARYQPENLPEHLKAQQPEGATKYFSWLAAEDKPEKVRRLVGIGAKLDVASAAAYGYIDRVREAIREDPAAVNGVPVASPLMFAARGGHLEIVKLLLDAGADVNPDARLGTWPGTTPLEAAARRGHVEVMRVLIERGADVNVRDEDGDTLLKRLRFDAETEHRPVNTAVVDLLRRHGAVE